MLGVDDGEGQQRPAQHRRRPDERCRQGEQRPDRDAQRRQLEMHETAAYLIDSRRRLGPKKATPEWVAKVWAWIVKCKVVRVSPITKDVLLVRSKDASPIFLDASATNVSLSPCMGDYSNEADRGRIARVLDRLIDAKLDEELEAGRVAEYRRLQCMRSWYTRASSEGGRGAPPRSAGDDEGDDGGGDGEGGGGDGGATQCDALSRLKQRLRWTERWRRTMTAACWGTSVDSWMAAPTAPARRSWDTCSAVKRSAWSRACLRSQASIREPRASC